jgi:acetolactate synthase I/II/III large subunit
VKTTVELMAESFKALGTPFIVGHPGGESVELMEAARLRDMRFILMKQEVAGAMLASTWGEITGSPGVCLSTRGPGAANMVNGIAHAMLDRAPLIALTDRYSVGAHEVGLRQRIDQKAMIAPLVKWSTTLEASVVGHQLKRAARTALAHAPGPVHIDIPQSETTKPAGGDTDVQALLINQPVIVPDRQSLSALITKIDAASKPVLLVGLGVLWDKASQELIKLAEHLGAPVLTTSKTKGAVPEDHPLRAGCIIGGLIERKLVLQSDLIITIGVDAVELQPKPWPYTIPTVSLASIESTDGFIPAEIEMVSNLRVLMQAVVEYSRSKPSWGEAAAKAFRQDVRLALDTPSTGLPPQRLMEVARAVLPRQTIATCDAGASRLLVVQKWESYGPREFLTSNGLGSMGFAIPGAMAAKLAHPDRPVVAFTGDGGAMMAIAEIQTAVKEDLPIIVVVLDDQEIGLIRVKQELKGITRHGVAIGGIDWGTLARGMGAEGTTVSTENELQDALQVALKSNRTTVIGARIDPSGYVAQFNALREL